MFRQSTPTRHYHGVTDDAGGVVKVFQSRFNAEQMIRDFTQTRTLLRRGANPQLAFPPSTNVAFLTELAKRTDHLKVVELKEELAPGTTVKSEDIARGNWTRRPTFSLPLATRRS